MDFLMGHLIGDYLLQDDWQAQNKKSSSLACGVHVLLYTAAVFVLTGWPWWAMLIVAVTHFAQDRTNFVVWFMKLKNQAKFAEPPMAPWSIILVDNVLHLVVLYVLSCWVHGESILKGAALLTGWGG